MSEVGEEWKVTISGDSIFRGNYGKYNHKATEYVKCYIFKFNI